MPEFATTHLGLVFSEKIERGTVMQLDDVSAAALLQSLPAGVVVHDRDTRVLYANPKALEILRITLDQALGKTALDSQWRFIDAYGGHLPVDQYPVNLVLASGKSIKDYVVGIVDGSHEKVTWVTVNAYQESGARDASGKIVVTFSDITASKKDIPFDAIVADTNDVVVVTVANPCEPRIVYVNKAFSELTGFSADEVYGKTPKILQGEGTSLETRTRIRAALANFSPIRETILNYDKQGNPYWLDLNIVPLRNALGEVCYFAAIERDVSAQKATEIGLKELSERDPLTLLLNRRGYTGHAQRVIARARRDGTELCVAMLDIDYFKRINDSLGHDVGDAALKHFSELMVTSFRQSDLIGRLGGEEFSIMMDGIDLRSCQRLLNSFREKVEAAELPLPNGVCLNYTVSVGVTSLRSDDTDISIMLKRADLALYEAKRLGRNRVCLMPSL